jgi:anti-sigma regulatory factor (Ser/Thr protein kinase)
VEADLPRTIRHRLALLLSEVVTKAVQHGGAVAGQSMQIRVVSSPERVRVEVRDPGGSEPRPSLRVEDEGEGYGTLLIERLSDRFGRAATDAGGTLAWFELDLQGLAES